MEQPGVLAEILFREDCGRLITQRSVVQIHLPLCPKAMPKNGDFQENLKTALTFLRDELEMLSSYRERVNRKGEMLAGVSAIVVSLLVALQTPEKLTIFPTLLIKITFLLGLSLVFASSLLGILSLTRGRTEEPLFNRSTFLGRPNLRKTQKEFLKDVVNNYDVAFNADSEEVKKKEKFLEYGILFLYIGLGLVVASMATVLVN